MGFGFQVLLVIILGPTALLVYTHYTNIIISGSQEANVPAEPEDPSMVGAACFEPAIIVPLKIQGKRHNKRACPKFILTYLTAFVIFSA